MNRDKKRVKEQIEALHKCVLSCDLLTEEEVLNVIDYIFTEKAEQAEHEDE